MEKLMKAMYDCGIISEENLKKIGITDNAAVEKLISEKLIERKTANINDKVVPYLQLTDLGEKHWRIGHPGKYHFYRNMNIEKMLLLSDFYCNLSEEERNSWRNKDEWLLEDKPGKPVDGTYRNGKSLLGVAVIASNSSKQIINEIERFVKSCKIKNLNYIFY